MAEYQSYFLGTPSFNCGPGQAGVGHHWKDDCCQFYGYKCQEGEGDCDTDADCAPGLVCGKENCGPGYPASYDCCETPATPGRKMNGALNCVRLNYPIIDMYLLIF